MTANPLFTNLVGMTYAQAGSPAIDRGDSHKTTSTGSGIIKVSDARYFHDGYGSWVSGDTIK
jgi:hypothetical protein